MCSNLMICTTAGVFGINICCDALFCDRASSRGSDFGRRLAPSLARKLVVGGGVVCLQLAYILPSVHSVLTEWSGE